MPKLEAGYWRIGDEAVINWYLEDDGTYTKMLTVWGKDRKMSKFKVLESEVSQEEYFRRKLANKL